MIFVACGSRNEANDKFDSSTNGKEYSNDGDNFLSQGQYGNSLNDNPSGEFTSPDLTGKTIRIYRFADFSDEHALFSDSVVNGSKDFVTYLNENLGIFGATFEVKFVDTRGNLNETIAAYESIINNDKNPLLFIVYGAEEEVPLYDQITENQIPIIIYGYDFNSDLIYDTEDGYIFSMVPTYPGQFGYFLNYLVVNWANVKPVGAENKIKVAYLSWPGAYGQAALTDNSLDYASSLGVNIVHQESFDKSPSANTTQAIFNAQIAGANVIYTNTLGYGSAALLNGINDLGLRENFVVGGNFWAADIATYNYLVDPNYSFGFYAPFPIALWQDTENPAIQFAEKLIQENNRSQLEYNIGRLMIQASLDLAKKAIEDAVLEIGYDDLTGQDIYNALIQIEEYQVMGGLMEVTYTDGMRSPILLQMRQIQGSPEAFVILQDFTQIPNLLPSK